MSDNTSDSTKNQTKTMLDYQERLLIGQKQIRNALKQLNAHREKSDLEVLANQQVILDNQVEAAATLREIKVHQKQLKSSQDRLDTFFSTLETIIGNQDRIQGNQKTIIENQMKIVENQMKIMEKIDLVSK